MKTKTATQAATPYAIGQHVARADNGRVVEIAGVVNFEGAARAVIYRTLDALDGHTALLASDQLTAGVHVRLPRMFFDDHADRCGAETPAVVRETRSSVWVSTADPHFDALIADAEWYAEGNTDAPAFTQAARRLLTAAAKGGR